MGPTSLRDKMSRQPPPEPSAHKALDGGVPVGEEPRSPGDALGFVLGQALGRADRYFWGLHPL